jgi:branched-chain amino acid transport system ATP-binding protein
MIRGADLPIELKIEKLEARIGTGPPLIFASTILDFESDRPLVLLRGDNGAGKTTLLNLLSGYIRPIRGFAALNGVPLSDRGVRWGTKNGIVRGFQTPLLCNDLTVWENVALPALAKWWSNPRSMAQAIATRLEELGITKVSVSPGELSFGQRRIIEMARIEMQLKQSRPRFLLLDEPLAGLDPVRRTKVMDMICDIVGAGVPTMIVEHDSQVERLAEIASEVQLINRDAECELHVSRVSKEAPALCLQST